MEIGVIYVALIVLYGMVISLALKTYHLEHELNVIIRYLVCHDPLMRDCLYALIEAKRSLKEKLTYTSRELWAEVEDVLNSEGKK